MPTCETGWLRTKRGLIPAANSPRAQPNGSATSARPIISGEAPGSGGQIGIVKETSLHLAQNERDFLRASQAQSRREFLQRVALPSLLAALLLTAATFWLLQPRQDRIQLYDAATGEQVLRPFSIAFGGIVIESVDGQVAAFLAAESRRNPPSTVQCKGFEDHVREARYLGDQRLVRLYVARNEEQFLLEIVPNTNEISGVPTDKEIQAELSQNTLEPREVTLLVRNRSRLSADVIMVFRPRLATQAGRTRCSRGKPISATVRFHPARSWNSRDSA